MPGNTRKPRMTVADVESVVDPTEVITLKSDPKNRKVEWRDAFSLDGTMYQIRATAPVNVGLRYIHLARTRGMNFANDYVLENLLAPGAYEALMGFDDLTDDHVRAVLDIANKVLIGEVDTPN